MNETERIARRILKHLVDHPDAEGTIESVLEWWLLEEHIREQTPLVEDALEQLSTQKLLVKYTGGDLRVSYRVNRAKLSEIGAFLEKS